MSDKVRPGQQLDESISANTWNNIQDVVDDYKRRRRLARGLSTQDDQYPTDVVKVRNDSCDDRDEGEVLEVCTNLIDLTRRDLWFTAALPEASGKCFGVVRRALPLGDIDELQVSGVVRALVTINNAEHNRCSVVAGSTALSSDTTGPCRILWKPSGTGLMECAVLIESPCTDATITTTTLPPQGSNPCAGTCTWTWSAANKAWSVTSDGCGLSTTTTTTLAPTTPPPACYCGAATTTTASPTTTSSPTTTTTPDCQCLYPPYCGEVDGEISATFCGSQRNGPPSCGTTTTTTASPTTTSGPTTTTTCDCSGTTTTTTADCSAGCDWSYLPSELGGIGWKKIRDNCPSSCPCPAPSGSGSNCETQHTACVRSPSTTTPPTPSCTGYCEWWWIPDQSDWWMTRHECSTSGGAPCGCQRPSSPGDNCGPVRMPCAPAATTAVPDPCQYVCYPTTTTTTTTLSPTTTTTTTSDCLECKWEWDNTTSVWVMVQDNCGSCPCGYPALDGGAGCETIWAPCGNTTAPPTTTTAAPTTTTTTTTTTSSPTTTTTCTPGSGTRIWTCTASPPGCCSGNTTAGPGCSPFWKLTENNCCGTPDQCLAPQTPCDCDQVGHKITCPCGSTSCTTTTTTTPCPDCDTLADAGSGCPDGADCCCSYRCDKNRRAWELNEVGSTCSNCPPVLECLEYDVDVYNSCLDGSIDCVVMGDNKRCRYCSCGCTTTTTTTTGSPTTTTTCAPSSVCYYEWQGSPSFEWTLMSSNCETGQEGVCQPPAGNGDYVGEIREGSVDCCGN